MPQPPGRSVVEAVLMGFAAGEALGLPASISGETPPEPRPLPLGGVAAYGAATEQALVLAEVLADNCGFNPSDFASRLAERADVDNPVRLYSLATAEHIMLVRRGYTWAEARDMVASLEPPLDAVARAVVIPLFYTKERLVAEMAAAQLLTTSPDRRASVAARTYALSLYYMLHGLPPVEAVEEAASQTPRQAIRDSLYAAIDAALSEPERLASIVAMPGDPLAQLLASAAVAPLLASRGLDAWRALRASMAAAPPQAAHTAVAMAGALLAAAGGTVPVPVSLEAGPWVDRVSSRLSAANRSCRGVAGAEPAGSIAGSSK